jgi:hypothetical protein
MTAVILLTASLSPAARAQAPPPGNVIQILGAGMETCARWLSAPALKSEGDVWLQGYWSGRSLAALENRQRPSVGASTDSNGILREIETNCRYAPSQKLLSVAGNVYTMFENAGR